VREQIKKILLIIIVTVIALAYIFHFDYYFTLASFKEHRTLLRSFVDTHYPLSVFAYIFCYIFFITFSLPTGGLLTLLGGFLFGMLLATLYVLIGATTGAACAFLLTRYLIGNDIQEKYGRYTKRMNTEIARYGYSYLLMLRLVTVVPFFLVNLLAGVTQVSFFTFVWTTAVGIIPATMIIAFAGQELATINAISDIFSQRLILSFVLLGFLSLLPMIFHRLRKRRML
jgi:uncharacterized membrane protein YdjX (TVP38/TMEM64 family)